MSGNEGVGLPPGITPATVGGVIETLGYPTIEQVAAELSKAAGVRVSGRAVQMLARLAGAKSDHPEFGPQRAHRYWMPFGAPTDDVERLIRDVVYGLQKRSSDPRTFDDECQYALRKIGEAVPESTEGALRRTILKRLDLIADAHGWAHVTPT